MTVNDVRLRPRAGATAALVLGVLAVVAATVVGWNDGLLDVVAKPPVIVRALLVGVSVAVGAMLLGRSISRLSEGDERDVPALIRAVRLGFLAVAALAAGAGWAIGHPLPLIIAAVIAGIDVVETSFLLIVVGRR